MHNFGLVVASWPITITHAACHDMPIEIEVVDGPSSNSGFRHVLWFTIWGKWIQFDEHNFWYGLKPSENFWKLYISNLWNHRLRLGFPILLIFPIKPQTIFYGRFKLKTLEVSGGRPWPRLNQIFMQANHGDLHASASADLRDHLNNGTKMEKPWLFLVL